MIIKELWKSLGSGQFSSGQFKRLTKNKQEIWIEASYNPIFNAKGEVIKVIKYATDVTESVKQKKEFEILSLVANKTNNSVIITDRSGHIEYVNDGFERMTGYKSDEVIGRKPGSFLQGPETDPETIKSVSERLKAAEPFYHEILNYTKEGEPYWISLSITPIFNEYNECERFVSIQANITQIKLKAIEYTKCIENIEKTNIALSWDSDLILTSAMKMHFL